MGLLSRLLLGAGVGSGVGALTAGPDADSNDILMRALVGAGSGAAVGGGVGHLLSRGGSKLPKMTQADYQKAILELRKSMPGITPQQASQFPPGDFTKKLEEALKAKIAADHPQLTERPFKDVAADVYGTTKKALGTVTGDIWNAAEDTTKRLEGNLHSVWDGVDRATNRGLGMFKYPAMAAGGALAVGIPVNEILAGQGYSQSLFADNTAKQRDEALKALNMPIGEIGLRAFQKLHKLPVTGKMDDMTKTALGVEMASATTQTSQPLDPLTGKSFPKPPSLAPHRQR